MVLKIFQHVSINRKRVESQHSSRYVGQSLRILSHNVAQDLSDYQRLDDLICKVNADLVLLQEITADYVDGHWAALSHQYPYFSSGPFLEKKRVASVILSKYPIIETDNFKLAEIGIVFQQRALIDIQGITTSVYNIHLTFPWINLERISAVFSLPWPKYNDRARSAEIRNLVKMLREEDNPVIAAGDFNLSIWSHDYKKLTEVVADAYRSCGRVPGFSWPANRTPSLYIPLATPIVRIDYLFHSSAFKTDYARFLARTGSDHLPLLVGAVLGN